MRSARGSFPPSPRPMSRGNCDVRMAELLSSARGLASPRPGGGADLTRIAELMRQPDPAAATGKLAGAGLDPLEMLSDVGRGPHATVLATCGRGASPVPAFGKVGPLVCSPPSWGEAAIRTIVQQTVQQAIQMQLQACVAPRLEGLSDRLAGVVASAQSHNENARRDLERQVASMEARYEGRLSGLEANSAVLHDGATRAEHRERDLNMRIASLGESLMQSSGREVAEEARAGRLDELDRRTQALESRVGQTEEGSKKGTKATKRLDERFEEFSQGMAKQEEELRSIRISHAHWADKETVSVIVERLGAFEEHICHLEAVVAEQRLTSASAQNCRTDTEQVPPSISRHSAQIEELRAQVEALRDQLVDHNEQARLRIESASGELRTACEQRQSLVSRLDDFNARVGALKVKTDGLEGRLSSIGDRVSASTRPLEASFREQLADRCNKVASTAEARMDDLEQQLEALKHSCEDLVESSLQRRPVPFNSTGMSTTASKPRHGTPPSRDDFLSGGSLSRQSYAPAETAATMSFAERTGSGVRSRWSNTPTSAREEAHVYGQEQEFRYGFGQEVGECARGR